MLSYSEIKPRVTIMHEEEPWEVIDSQVSRKQQNKPVNKTKLKNLITGRVIDYTFHVSDKVNTVDIIKKPMQYVYVDTKKGGVWFSDPENPRERVLLSETIVGKEIQFIREKSVVDAKVFVNQNGEEQLIGIDYPTKTDLVVTEAPPNIRGDTATGGTKIVTLETGATLSVPLFISVDDVVSVNTETGQYSGRVEKA